jgi:hypothetical protein
MLHGDGATFTQFSQGSLEQLESISATSDINAWAVGGHGTALHWDGKAWTSTVANTEEGLYAVLALGNSDAVALGSTPDCIGFVLRWNGTQWATVFSPPHGDCLTSLSGSAGNLWAAGSSGLFHAASNDWQSLGPTDASGAVWANSATDVWVLQIATPDSQPAPGGVYHFDGANWTLQPTGAESLLQRVWSSGPNDVWAVGDDDTQTWHRDASGWKAFPSGLEKGNGLDALWGSGPSDAWAGSRSGAKILHWDGAAWTATTERTVGVTAFATDASGTWAAGPGGMILRRAR